MSPPIPDVQPAVVVERHYRRTELPGILSVSQSWVDRAIKLGRKTRGREGLYPTRKLSRRVILVPASAVNRLLASFSQ